MKKKVVATGLVAGLIAGAGVGFALEASGSAGASAPVVIAAGDTTTTVTGTGTDTGTDTDQLDRSARLKEVLQPLVDDGTLTQDQLDKVIAALDAAGPADGGMGGHGMGGPGAGLDTVASTLGLTVEEVRTAISNGQTLAQLAEANGSSGQELIDALVVAAKAHLDEEVAAGEHTQDEADAKLVEATTRITEFVNNTPAEGPMGGGMGGGHHGPGHDGGQSDSTGTGTGGVIDAGPSDTSTTTG